MKSLLGNVADQRELFLMKFPDIDRVDVLDMFDAFVRFDKTKSGDLDEHAIQLMMADLGVHKTLVELRTMLSTIDFTLGKRVQFCELLCASFGKDYQALLDHTDAAAVANAKAKADSAKNLEDEIARKHAADDAAERELQSQLEREAGLTGVAYQKAFFHRAALNNPDSTMTNADKIKQEAAFRRAQKAAQKALEQAEADMKAKNKSDEEVRQHVHAMADKLKAEADAAAAAAVEQERQERAARKAAFNARFSGH